MNRIKAFEPYALQGRLDLSSHDFAHQSEIHGVLHTYRVMTHCLAIGQYTGYVFEANLALCAAFIHDLERTHDGYCTMHGEAAAKNRYPEFIPLFRDMGVLTSQDEIVKTAVAMHSVPEELPANHRAAKVTAILKDADALDRIRLGADNLNVDFLRFPVSAKLVAPAIKLYHITEKQRCIRFAEVLDLAREISLISL